MGPVIHNLNWKRVGNISNKQYTTDFRIGGYNIWYIAYTNEYIITCGNKILFSDPNLESVIMWGIMNDANN